MMLLLIPMFAFGQEFRALGYDTDSFKSTNGTIYRYDKVEHFVGSAVLTHTLMYISDEKGWKYALLAGLAWELKDGFVPYEKYGKWGGEGFSPKDLLADASGVLTGYLFHKGWHWLTKKGGGGHKVHRIRQ